ncbi:hypothetical protein B0H19DRAFT_933701, partial [Mycena capillaripes]
MGWESQERGVLGHTNAYYATVEQQGRLTLHLHSVIWIANALSPQEIRDRLMGPKSAFRKRLIAYLEDAHRAKYFHGSRDAVIAARKVEPLSVDADSDEEIDWESGYRPPTQTLPQPPPPPCSSKVCTELCADCRRSAAWWEGYILEVDDLLVRSNVHTHFLSVEHQQPDFKFKRERKGCLTKTGVCRARFPREVFTASEMTDDGHINVRHIEPMMNMVNPILTFLNRCNTDVSSMLSGTAVKAVVSYVSDYISKLSLKSYQMFASVYDVFEKESEMRGGSERDKNNARHMMRKMVNSMSAKMEIGSPMASMYLLGNPDHYTSHNYVPFAWRQYVQFVRDFWVDSLKEEEEEDEDEAEGLGRDDEERVRIGRMGSNFVPSSSVDDYRYRPTVYFNMNLYEWIQCSSKRKRSVRELTNFEENIRTRLKDNDEPSSDYEDLLEDEPDDELYFDDADLGAEKVPLENDGESDWETDDEDDVILDKEAKRTKTNKSSYHPFMPPHSLFRSHCATCNFDNIYTMIPNFIGGSIPRSDKGDRAAYCMTMLTLFKPWRSPSDLKDNISTWDQAFKEHKFTERQSQLIKNFDVRYECNDARDDHFTQMKKRMSEAKAAGKNLWPDGFLSHKDKFADDLNDFDYGSDDEDIQDNDDDVEKGPKTLRILAEARDIRNIMQTSGWLDPCIGGLPYFDSDRLMPSFRPRMEWVNIVKHQRMELTTNKLANLPPIPDSKKRKVHNGTSILPHDYFNRRNNVDPTTNSDIMSSIIMSYGLNSEQTRAFRIVADHAS